MSEAALAFLVCRASSRITFRSVSEMACTDFGEDSKENVDLEGETWSAEDSGTSKVVGVVPVVPAGLVNGLVEVEEGRDIVVVVVVVADESWVECGILCAVGEEGCEERCKERCEEEEYGGVGYESRAWEADVRGGRIFLL